MIYCYLPKKLKKYRMFIFFLSSFASIQTYNHHEKNLSTVITGHFFLCLQR